MSTRIYTNYENPFVYNVKKCQEIKDTFEQILNINNSSLFPILKHLHIFIPLLLVYMNNQNDKKNNQKLKHAYQKLNDKENWYLNALNHFIYDNNLNSFQIIHNFYNLERLKIRLNIMLQK